MALSQRTMVQSIPVEYILGRVSGYWGELELLKRLNFSTNLGYIGHEVTPEGRIEPRVN